MNIKPFIFTLTCLPVFLYSCSVQKQEPAFQETSSMTLLQTKAVNDSGNAMKGSLLLFLDEDSARKINEGQRVAALDSICGSSGATLSRLFRCRDMENARRFGLDRWYRLDFSEDIPVEEVAERFAASKFVSRIQYNTILERSFDGTSAAWEPVTRSAAYDLPFNDPKLIDQWHYINNADLSIASTSRIGADINVKDAWRLCTGDPEIIVAICDEAVKYTHPDLAANMWVNEGEIPGNGIDDDGNGYIDDVHGYNFLSSYDPETGKGVVLPISWDNNGDTGHGTHVAGTVAAVNNNGIGVSGVAGGSGNGDGVRLMSCQIFSGKSVCGVASRALAYEYAMDHGASILQCSFGLDAGVVDSDSYFNAVYGAEVAALSAFIHTPAPGNPAGGNFVVFAAGNDGYEMSGYPAAYTDYISVAAIGPDFLPASYTNYGPGTKISAPGGDLSINYSSAYPYRSQILSTLPKEIGGSDYGYMQGTSMACPHVSGVIALGLSYARKLNKTFTYEEFLGLIYSSVSNVDYYIETSTKLSNGVDMNLAPYWKNMGTGNIDAWKLLMQIEGTPCLSVKSGELSKVSLKQLFGDSYSNLTYTAIDMDDEARETLGVEGTPYIKYGNLYIECHAAGSSKIRISAVTGGAEGSSLGATFTREFALMSSESGSADNGGWL